MRKIYDSINIFATFLLFLGLIGALIMVFTVVFVSVPSSPTSELVFSAEGFAYTAIEVVSTLALFFILKGIAAIGQDVETNKQKLNRIEIISEEIYAKLAPEEMTEDTTKITPQTKNEKITPGAMKLF